MSLNQGSEIGMERKGVDLRNTLETFGKLVRPDDSLDGGVRERYSVGSEWMQKMLYFMLKLRGKDAYFFVLLVLKKHNKY